MPQSIDVYLDGGKETTSIPVTWSCVGDYDTTNYFVYEFDPKWDTDQYSLGAGQKDKIPYINVICRFSTKLNCTIFSEQI